MKSRLTAAALAAVAVALLSPAGAAGDVRLTRRGDGRAIIFNDVGSGWTVGGRTPSDDYLVSRRDAATPYDEAIGRHAGYSGVDARLVKSVMLVESNFNPRAMSRKGARGLMQLMPLTARRFGVGDSFNAEENIRGGVRYLSELLQMFRGDVSLALAAYNAGEGAVQKHGGVPPYPETREYVRRTLIAYGGAPSSSHVLAGGFKGRVQGTIAESGTGRSGEPRLVKALRAAPTVPVKLQERDGQVRMSNSPGDDVRPAPVLGRIADASHRPGR
jgi:hypothetical protein